MLLFILTIAFIISLGIKLLDTKFTYRLFEEEQSVELIWTLLPSFILMRLRIPALNLLYFFDEMGPVRISVKALGHQWYWHYDYPCGSFDSYIKGSYRVLEADHRIFTPTSTGVRLLIRAADVLHSWTIPTMGLKADAVPGRVNKLSLFTKRPGVYYGQCREICGRNHSFMPISIERVIFNLSYTLKV